MIKIYQIDGCGQWTGAVAGIEASDGCSPTWVRAPEPPATSDDMVAVWVGGEWHVTEPVGLTSTPSEPGT